MAARTLAIIALIASTVQAICVEDCVFLTVSSLWTPRHRDQPLVERELELNWADDPVCDYPDRVGLFPADPRTLLDVDDAALFWAETEWYPEGFLKTNVSLERPSLPGGWDEPGDKECTSVDLTEAQYIKGDHCYPYWIASFNGSDLLHMNCLKIRPTWMADHRKELSRMPLDQLVIAGTHDSACYQFPNKTAVPSRDAFSRYLLTQDSDIWTQLVHGIRYLDFRIGYYSSKSKDPADRFWINHSIVKVAPMVPILRQVVRFVKASPDEVVIVDFHRFPVGMDGHAKRHCQLIALLKKELGELAIPPPPAGAKRYTLGDAWQQGKRLVVSYGERQAAEDTEWLWPPLPQMWGSQQTVSGLRDYVHEVMEKPRREPNELWAVMAELTPTPFDVIFNLHGSVRKMADAVNRNLTQWIRDIWWERANIVATDYFLGNNIIDVAVRVNIRKSKMDCLDGISRCG